MKPRVFAVSSLIIVLAVLLTTLPGRAAFTAPQRLEIPLPTTAPILERDLASSHSVLSGGLESQDANAPAAVGQAGLSFRYVQTLGQTEVAYIPDTTHINKPYGVGVDGTNVWIADSWGDRALKFSGSDGSFVTQIGKPGFREATDTSLDYVTDVAVDAGGNTWVVDGGAAHVVKFNSSGQRVSELGQAWNSGTANDQFNSPIGIAFDSAGNIYVSDTGLWGSYGNHRIQVFNSSGAYLKTIGETGVAGSGNDHFREPRHLALYANTLYIADAGNHRIQIFDVSTPTSPAYMATLGVTGVPGTGNNQFDYPQGVAVDANYIYVADSNNNRIQIFGRTTRTFVATLGGSCGSGNYQFCGPSDVAADPAGNIYVADASHSRVQQFDSNRNWVRTFGTTDVPYLTDGYHYNSPVDVAAAPDGSLYVIENRGHRLLKLDAAGQPLWTIGEAGQPGSDNSHLSFANGVALDGLGRVYVADTVNNRIQIFSSNGSYVTTLGTGEGTGDYQFNQPNKVAIDKSGNIYVVDTGNQRVQIYDNNRVYVRTLGTSGVSGSDNTHFDSPRDVGVDAAGNVYVVDLNNHRVQKCVPGGSTFVCATFIGVTGVSGSDFAHLSNPLGIAVDADGRIYVSDQWGGRVQVFDVAGAYLTTVGGSNGNLTGQMRQADGLAVDSDGNLYVADYLNHRVQKFAPGVPGWMQTNINGFGDPANGNIHSLASFGGQLYAGTYNGNGAQIWRASTGNDWTRVITPGFGILSNVGMNHLLTFNNQLYVGVRNDTDGASVYRSSDGNTWNPVVTSGFTDTNNAAVYRLAVFNGQIYAGTGIFTATHGAEIWRSANGDVGTWTPVVGNGFGDPNNFIMRTSEVYSGYLYFGTQNVNTSNYMTTTGGIIIRSNTGDSGSWTKVTLGGFGDINNYTVSGLASFGGYLYASTSRWNNSGIQVWRCQTCDSPGDWQKVVDNGFGNPYNWGLSTLQVFDGKLYLAIGNGLTGMEVWRTSTGNSGEWTQISSGGFGDSNNTSPYYSNVTVFNNRLYIGMQNNANGPEIWKKTVTADFTASPVSGPPPLTVVFTNTSAGDYTTAQWDFGNGQTFSGTATLPPAPTYMATGLYTVTLTVGDGVDTSTRTHRNYIQVMYRIYLPLTIRN